MPLIELFHSGNMGSTPLGDANKFNGLHQGKPFLFVSRIAQGHSSWLAEPIRSMTLSRRQSTASQPRSIHRTPFIHNLFHPAS